MHTHKLAKGFTLTELMVTLAVLAVLVTIAVPSFSGMIATQATRNASFDLTSAMSLARSEAVKQNTIATISASSSWATGWTLAVNGAIVRTFGPYSGVTIAPSNGNTLSFGNDGRPTVGSVTFQITPTSSSQSVSPSCVQVGGTGRVAVVSGTCS
jgi:type IV fimbrial biogenesis protein FimT